MTTWVRALWCRWRGHRWRKCPGRTHIGHYICRVCEAHEWREGINPRTAPGLVKEALEEMGVPRDAPTPSP